MWRLNITLLSSQPDHQSPPAPPPPKSPPPPNPPQSEPPEEPPQSLDEDPDDPPEPPKLLPIMPPMIQGNASETPEPPPPPPNPPPPQRSLSPLDGPPLDRLNMMISITKIITAQQKMPKKLTPEVVPPVSLVGFVGAALVFVLPLFRQIQSLKVNKSGFFGVTFLVRKRRSI